MRQVQFCWWGCLGTLGAYGQMRAVESGRKALAPEGGRKALAPELGRNGMCLAEGAVESAPESGHPWAGAFNSLGPGGRRRSSLHSSMAAAGLARGWGLRSRGSLALGLGATHCPAPDSPQPGAPRLLGDPVGTVLIPTLHQPCPEAQWGCQAWVCGLGCWSRLTHADSSPDRWEAGQG